MKKRIRHSSFFVRNSSVERLVSRILFRPSLARGTAGIIRLPLALPRWSSNLPGGFIRKRAVPLPPYLVLLRRGFAMPSRSRGPRCALTAPFHPCLYLFRDSSAVYSLLHFPSRHRAWPLASLLPVGVRTFLRVSRRGDPRAAPHVKSNRDADRYDFLRGTPRTAAIAVPGSVDVCRVRLLAAPGRLRAGPYTPLLPSPDDMKMSPVKYLLIQQLQTMSARRH
jgi:hypothetical protein